MDHKEWRIVLSPEVKVWQAALTGLDAAIAHAAISRLRSLGYRLR